MGSDMIKWRLKGVPLVNMAAREAKICLVGSNGVGKTCLAERYCSGQFSLTESPTVGLKYFSKRTEVKGCTILMKIFDIGGNEKNRVLSRSILSGSRGAIGVYDITDTHSFDNMKAWLKEVNSCIAASVVVGVVGNKLDMSDQRQVTAEEGEAYAREVGGFFVEMSVRDNNKVKDVFQELCEHTQQN
jgi:small GTP-binding protein